jgi:hypothetical protein
MVKGQGGFFGFGPAGQNELTFFTVEAYIGGRAAATCTTEQYSKRLENLPTRVKRTPEANQRGFELARQ